MIWLGTKYIIAERATSPICSPDRVVEKWCKIFQAALIQFRLVYQYIPYIGGKKEELSGKRTLSKSRYIPP